MKTITGGRTAAIEILLNSPLIAELIMNADVGSIKPIMAKSRDMGMQTFDQALFDAYEDGQIDLETALANADSSNELRLKIKLESKESKGRDPLSGLEHLEFQEEDDDTSI